MSMNGQTPKATGKFTMSLGSKEKHSPVAFREDSPLMQQKKNDDKKKKGGTDADRKILDEIESKAYNQKFRTKKEALDAVKTADSLHKVGRERGDSKLWNRALGAGDIAHDAAMNDFDTAKQRRAQRKKG